MTAITTEMTVFNAKDKYGVLSQDTVRIRFIDEGGGFFIELEQEDNRLRLDFSELQELQDAIQYMKVQYELQGLL